MARRYSNALIYTIIIVFVVSMTFIIVGKTYLTYLCADVTAVQNEMPGPIVRPHERVEYDKLLHYILHPKPVCQSRVILGGNGRKDQPLDGDKVICMKPGQGLKEPCIAYSIGISNEWSFDEAIHSKFGCKVFSFDPSMDVNDHMHSSGIWFYKMGIGEVSVNLEVNKQVWKMRTLDDIFEMLGHRNETIDVLKMDIEGAEFVVIEDLLEKGLLKRVNHLCVEIHLQEMPYWNRVYTLLKRIEEEAGLLHFSTRNNTRTQPARVPGNYARYEQHYFELAWFRY